MFDEVAYQNYIAYIHRHLPNTPIPTRERFCQLISNNASCGIRFNNNYVGDIRYSQGPQEIEGTSSSSNRDSQSSSGEVSASCEASSSSKTRIRWSHNQTAVLVQAWTDNIDDLESALHNMAQAKIKNLVAKAGAYKTVKQCRDKIRNLKNDYSKAKDNNKRTGASPQFPTFYQDFDRVLGQRDISNTPNAMQVGARLWMMEKKVY